MDPTTSTPALVTGACGFIGSALVRALRRRWPTRPLVSVDALTYAGDLQHLAFLDGDPFHAFVHADVRDRAAIRGILEQWQPGVVFHLAAESHVDRSILDPGAFIQTNVDGTAVILQEAHRAAQRSPISVLYVSTDEVYGPTPPGTAFDESQPLAPSSPYAASKAAGDLLALAWHRTYGLDVRISRCTNNYGPRQFPEKLLPVVVSRALGGEPVPLYGDGRQRRDWIHVDDHAAALIAIAERGTAGRVYGIGARHELENRAIVHRVLDLVDECLGQPVGRSRSLVVPVTDRPGHDARYALNPERARVELGWAPTVSFDDGIRQTVSWYINNQEWVLRMRRRQSDFEAQWYQR